MQETKRRFSRITLAVPAEVSISNAPSFSVNELANLSVGGCLVPVEKEYPVGESCRLTIPLPGGDETLKIDVLGSIVRCEGGYIALQFHKINPESLFHLQNIIRYNAPDPEQIDEEINQRPGLI